MKPTSFGQWWLVNHPRGWWASPHAEPLPHWYRLPAKLLSERAYNEGFQAGADARAKQCAEMADIYDIDVDDPDRKFHTPSRIANQMRGLVGQPVEVKEK